MAKYIYGLDLSMSCSGVTIYDLDSKSFVIVDSIKTKDKDQHGTRLHMQRNFLEDYMKEYPPYEVAIEKGFSRFNKSTQVVFRVHGVANELYHEYEQYYYTPNMVKKTITENGRASKEEVASEIIKKYPELRFNNDDESDSCAVLLTHLKKRYKVGI